MKTCVGVKVLLHTFLTSALGEREWSASLSRFLYPFRMSPS